MPQNLTSDELLALAGKVLDIESRAVDPFCKTTSKDVLAAQAAHVMEENKITSLLVADQANKLIGALYIHGLFRAGIM